MIAPVGIPGPSTHHLGFRAHLRRSLISAKTQVLLCLGVWHTVNSAPHTQAPSAPGPLQAATGRASLRRLSTGQGSGDTQGTTVLQGMPGGHRD